jgi:biotin carboxyl carrier protein
MKRSLLISGFIATVVTAFGAAGISSGELDLPGLNQRINNIDARTTNNEQDIVKLQETTQTAPAEHVAVPSAVMAPAPTAAPIAAQPAAAEPTPAATPAPTPVPTPCVAPVVSNAPGMTITVIGGGCQ